MPTKIEWTDETWNPVTGCSKVSEGCRHCYAERMARRLAGRYGYPEQPHHFDVTLHPEKLDEPLHWKKPRMVFIASMGDLFHKDIPPAFIKKVWHVMMESKQHIFQVLTKRPERAGLFLRGWYTIDSSFQELPPNIWLGVTAENQAAADERIPLLLQIPAAVRFVSCEPLLEEVNLSKDRDWLIGPPTCLECGVVLDSRPDPVQPCPSCGEWGYYFLHKLDWAIVGGESGPGARPMKLAWARSLVQQSKAAGVPVFVKQMGTHWAKYAEPEGDWHSTVKQQGDSKGHNMRYWPEDLQVREMPEVNK